jgi:hypothetical protein
MYMVLAKQVADISATDRYGRCCYNCVIKFILHMPGNTYAYQYGPNAWGKHHMCVRLLLPGPLT